MPKVLIVGATGYVGQALALSLIHSGNHIVYGLARSNQKARALAQQEILPVLCADFAKDPTALSRAIEHERISVVVGCGADQEAAQLLQVVRQAGKDRIDAYKAEGQVGVPKLGFIYVSGTWVHGSSTDLVSDLESAGTKLSHHPPPDLVSWRPALEQEVLKSRDVLDVLVVRPALVYGYSGGLLKPFLDPIIQGIKTKASTAQITLDATSYPGTIHLDDVASGLRLAIEQLPLFSGTSVYPIFDLGSQTESMQLIFETFAKHAGFTGKLQLVGAGGDKFAQAMSTSTNNDSSRAKILLGWQPTRASLVGGMGVYAKAMLASSL